MKKKIELSPNYSSKNRGYSDIKFVIFHYTGMQSEIASIKRLIKKNSKVSCHYLINRKGIIKKLVKVKNIAWHAGKSKWKNFVNLNKNSIGIELVNKGHEFGYQNFTNLQIKSLIILCQELKKKYRIKNSNFLGHSDIAPHRKIDPGEKFPWSKLSRFKIGKWYKKVKDKKFSRNLSINRQRFFKNIYKIGYRYFSLKKKSKKDELVIMAFQRKYLPHQISGIIDKKTLKISYFLANS